MNDWRDDLIRPPAAPSAHLDDSELIGNPRSTAAEKHLSDCAWCQRRASVAAPDDDFSRLLEQLDAAPIDLVLDAARGWKMPTSLRAVLAAEGTSPPVAPSQLWSMLWQGQQSLVAVIERHGCWVKVAPVTTDVELADEYALVLAAHDTSLGVPAVVFVRARATVPLFVLDRFRGDVHVEGATLAEMATRTERALRAGEPVVGVPTGRDLVDTDIDRLETLEALQEEMAWFEAAVIDVLDAEGDLRWMPGGEQSAVPALPAAELLRRPGLQEADLIESTGIEPVRVLELMRGGIEPNPAEVLALRGYFGEEIGSNLGEKAHLALIEVVSEPSKRIARQRWNADHAPDAGPETVGALIERVLQEPLAARTVTGSHEVDGSTEAWRIYWRSRLTVLLSDYL